MKNCHDIPINVTWMITNRCNYHCEFCFRFTDRKELDFATAKKIMDKLISAGVKKISWAGGEPLLWAHMLDLIEYSKQQGLQTMLITNGSLIKPEMYDRLEASLDWLNLPLEGPSKEINAKMTRGATHFDQTMKLLSAFKNRSVKLKINTVASPINIDYLVDLAQIIKNYKVKRWKIFQFYAVRGFSLKAKQKFTLNSEKFHQVEKQVRDKLKNYDCMVVFEDNRQLEKSYFALAPDGQVYVSDHGKDVFIGDLKKDDVSDVFFHPALDKKKYWQRNEWINADEKVCYNCTNQ